MSKDIKGIVLGVDALDPRWMKYWFAQGEMPYTRSLVQDGTVDLQNVNSVTAPSHSEPYTHIAWTSIYTGLQPAQHGVTSGPVMMRKHNFAEDVGATLFDDVSDKYKMASFRLPMTWPARPINGWMISGFPAGGRDGKGLTEREVYGLSPDDAPDDFHRMESTRMSHSDDAEYAKTLNNCFKKDRRGLEIFDGLLEGDEDVLMFGTKIADTVGHYFFENIQRGLDEDTELLDLPREERDFATSGAARIGYAAVDYLIEGLIEEYDPEYLWAIGDHGFDRYQENGHHAMPTAYLEYARDEKPAIGDATCITDLRDQMIRRLGLTRQTECFDGEETDTEVTQEEIDQVTQQLEDLGYM